MKQDFDEFLSEWEEAVQRVDEVIRDFIDMYGKFPVRCYVSDNSELQSLMMLACHTQDIPYERTEKKTYCV